MLIKKYKAEVAEMLNPVDSLYVVKLKSLDKPFRFLPGQFLHLSLEEYDPSGNWPESRCFSIQEIDVDGRIMLTFSSKGRYTTRMADELKAGKTVSVKMPYGSLFQDLHDKRFCVFIAGGTGITPFLSLFTDAGFHEYEKPKLYAGFRDKQLNIYNEYFLKAKSINSGFEVTIFYETLDGMLNIAKIFKDQPAEATFFLSGPPQMIRDFRGWLENRGVLPEKIRRDEWE
jgi:NAD(P)H-flavin reductase